MPECWRSSRKPLFPEGEVPTMERDFFTRLLLPFIRSLAFFHALVIEQNFPAMSGGSRTLVGLGFRMAKQSDSATNSAMCERWHTCLARKAARPTATSNCCATPEQEKGRVWNRRRWRRRRLRRSSLPRNFGAESPIGFLCNGKFILASPRTQDAIVRESLSPNLFLSST